MKIFSGPVKGVVIGGFFLALTAFFVGSAYWFSQPISSSAVKKNFVVNRGEPLKSISFRLQDQGLIKNSQFFQFLILFLQLNKKVQAGMFALSPSMSPKQIALELTRGRLDQWIKTADGWRAEQVANQVEKELGLDRNKFLSLARDKEGYLFPDSYLVPVYFNEQEVMEMMLNNFDKKTASLWPEAKKRGLNKNEAVIIASLVEREAKFDDDRRLVAGVLIKRWREGWPLQVDATVQYAKANQMKASRVWLDNWWPAITREDMKISSLYNTYRQKGLPSGPISNPSLKVIQAVVNYQKSDFWFYVSDAGGRVHFAKDGQEHEKNINRYLR